MGRRTPIRDWLAELDCTDRDRVLQASAADWELLGALVLVLGPVGPPEAAKEVRAVFLSALVRALRIEDSLPAGREALELALKRVAIEAVLRACDGEGPSEGSD